MKRIMALVLSGTFLTVFALGGAFAQDPAPAAANDQTKSEPAQQSQTPQGQPPHRQAKLDSNKDGSVDLAEFSNADRLKEADKDGDGKLSQEEMEALAMKRIVERQVQRMTKRLDVDGDGTVTIAEVEKQKAKRFALMDRNDDGKLEGKELRHGKRFHKGHHRGEHRQHERGAAKQ
ncbi:EF-hand domain-containing protein [Phyllobacterium sp. 21LDTY02-6]|uniref:EF-hand domain-containing protein n=1 Tax=Phyllobacterium sp. 21LDTY02-6 TaxID=2944903 RepID=UPI002020F42F|nr:EF-hand domain-containing protein [Phyllobacterium sp. 21LDTY02-6]MCO4319716.1 EF-hand domain-containing protein [Phyllobacterium sp. 21LDTY02-6]